MGRQIATFALGDKLLGLDILIVKEVYRHMELTPVPDSPGLMSGLMNLRGKVVTVIDLNVCLDPDAPPDPRRPMLLILKTDSEIQQYRQRGGLGEIHLGDDIVGFLIDRMEDVLDVDEEDVLPTPPNFDLVDRRLVNGVIKLDGRLVLHLDINEVLGRILEVSSEAQQ